MKPLSGWMTAALVVVTVVGCSDDTRDELGSSPVPLALQCGGGIAPLADEIALGCPVSATGLIAVDVLIGGPTSSSEIYGIGFDLVFDGAVVAFEPGAVEGGLLNQDGEATSLIANVDATDAGRVIVALTRLGQVGGVQAAGSQEPVVTLMLRAAAPGSTTVSFENAIVIDPAGTPIPLFFTGPLILDVS